MKGPHWGWYLGITIVVLAPAGVRLASWPGFRRQALDPQMVQAGQTLFLHEWKANDPLASGDGLGPVFNAASCVACHNQGGSGGAGGLEHNVTMFAFRSEALAIARGLPREGVIHANTLPSFPRESLADLHADLPAMSNPRLDQLVVLSGNSSNRGNHCIAIPPDVRLSQRNTPALWGANLIDAIPDRVIIANERKERLNWGLAPQKGEELPVGRALRLPDGRIGHFGWKAQSASLSDFVQAACANELGLGNPGQAQPTPFSKKSYQQVRYDLSQEQCDQITSFVASLARPIEQLPSEDKPRSDALAGKQLFTKVGCAECHTPNVGNVEGLYSDLLLHDMGQPLEGGGTGYNDRPPQPDPNTPPPSDGPNPGEWRTPPLWGVADSAPYLHDGRAPTLEKAIELHGGQGTRAAQSFASLSKPEQGQLIAFLRTLRAP